ncbi:hypothetical protein [Agromyces sp. LHK192]|uniref:hypothetical protein n=1 Tax=Agromyces sp. LHK192 TaxID=2498704 RepID=UPI000FD74F0C|nr:hypothetical protein [Agromyces sp. LHK192]
MNRVQDGAEPTEAGPVPEVRASFRERAAEAGRRAVAVRSNLWPALLFLVLIIALWGRPALGDWAHLRLANPGDAESFSFYLSWNVHALANFVNPFHTPNLYAPGGQDLGNAISLPTVSMLMAPITVLFGGTAAYNTALLLAIWLGTFAVYLLARELTGSLLGATAAGLLMLVAPYFTGHAQGHLNLMWVFATPLIGYLATRYVKGTLRPGWFVAWTAVLVAFTGGASTEVLVTHTLFIVLGVGVVICFTRGEVRRRSARSLLWLAAGGAIGAILLIPVVVAALQAGIPTSALNPPNLYSTELTNLVVPTRMSEFGETLFEGVREDWLSNDSENTAFLGIPLVLLLGAYAFATRHRFSGAVAAFGLIGLILSFGPLLTISGINTIPMPWMVATFVPGLDHALPGRFSLFVFMAACLLVADAVARRVVPLWITATLVAASFVLMVPNLSSMGFPTPAPISEFAAEDLDDVVEPGDNVLVLPPGQYGPGMRWMDELDFTFVTPTGNGGGANAPEAWADPVARALFDRNFDFDWDDELLPYLERIGVDLVIVDEGSDEWLEVTERALGPATEEIDGVHVWDLASD